MNEALFGKLRMAYMRGATWRDENGFADYLSKNNPKGVYRVVYAHLQPIGLTRQPTPGVYENYREPGVAASRKFTLGDMVRKKSGSWWEGRVVGFYSTEQTPDGVCVQLDKPMGPVQIYPASALEKIDDRV